MFGSSTAPEGLSGGNRTRILNTKMQAQRAGMGGNQAAVNSLRAVTGPLKKRPESNVSGYSDAGPTDVVQPTQQLQGSAAAGNQRYNLGALSALSAAPPPEDPVKKYNRDAAIERIMSSPEMMDTVTRLKLRNHFQGRPNNGIGLEALGIVKQMHGIQ